MSNGWLDFLGSFSGVSPIAKAIAAMEVAGNREDQAAPVE